MASIKRSVENFFENLFGELTYVLLFPGRNKKGAMELEEIVKIVSVAILILLMVAGVYLLFFNKGGRLLASIGSYFRLGA